MIRKWRVILLTSLDSSLSIVLLAAPPCLLQTVIMQRSQGGGRIQFPYWKGTSNKHEWLQWRPRGSFWELRIWASIWTNEIRTNNTPDRLKMSTTMKETVLPNLKIADCSTGWFSLNVLEANLALSASGFTSPCRPSGGNSVLWYSAVMTKSSLS